MRSLTVLLLISLFGRCFAGEILLPLNSLWKYKKGTAEVSNPLQVWRESGFYDAIWQTGLAPIYYGETFASGTAISDMRNSYTTLFLRNEFAISNPTNIDRLALRVLIDDGYIVWINGTEVARFNVPA